jgi:hypothetical protein
VIVITGLALVGAREIYMAVEAEPTSTILAARGDAIRVVPLHIPDELLAAPAAAPQLTYRGGALLTDVEVFTVFWGSGWQSGPQAGLIAKLNKFFDDILVSSLIDQLGEYSVAGMTIGHGKRTGTATITSPAIKHAVTDGAIQHMLRQEISVNAAFPKPGPNVLYFVYLPPGVSVTSQGSKSCTSFCGYHSDINGQIFYAVMPYAGCNGCLGGLAALDALTSTSSHELCEAITDAVPGQGWYDDQNGEIGDICAWKTKTVDGYTVQLEWSNKSNSCV